VHDARCGGLQAFGPKKIAVARKILDDRAT